MSRLHAVTASAPESARWFDAGAGPEIAIPQETIEGQPGVIVTGQGGRRRVRVIDRGIPRLTREMRDHDEGPSRIGLVADLTNPMWEHLVVEPRYRCLIAITHFANPDGDPGTKTRTWFSLVGQPLMAWAGFCRNTSEFGPVYAGGPCRRTIR